MICRIVTFLVLLTVWVHDSHGAAVRNVNSSESCRLPAGLTCPKCSTEFTQHFVEHICLRRSVIQAEVLFSNLQGEQYCGELNAIKEVFSNREQSALAYFGISSDCQCDYLTGGKNIFVIGPSTYWQSGKASTSISLDDSFWLLPQTSINENKVLLAIRACKEEFQTSLSDSDIQDELHKSRDDEYKSHQEISEPLRKVVQDEFHELTDEEFSSEEEEVHNASPELIQEKEQKLPDNLVSSQEIGNPELTPTPVNQSATVYSVPSNLVPHSTPIYKQPAGYYNTPFEQAPVPSNVPPVPHLPVSQSPSLLVNSTHGHTAIPSNQIISPVYRPAQAINPYSTSTGFQNSIMNLNTSYGLIDRTAVPIVHVNRSKESMIKQLYQAPFAPSYQVPSVPLYQSPFIQLYQNPSVPVNQGLSAPLYQAPDVPLKQTRSVYVYEPSSVFVYQDPSVPLYKASFPRLYPSPSAPFHQDSFGPFKQVSPIRDYQTSSTPLFQASGPANNPPIPKYGISPIYMKKNRVYGPSVTSFYQKPDVFQNRTDHMRQNSTGPISVNVETPVSKFDSNGPQLIKRQTTQYHSSPVNPKSPAIHQQSTTSQVVSGGRVQETLLSTASVTPIYRAPSMYVRKVSKPNLNPASVTTHKSQTISPPRQITRLLTPTQVRVPSIYSPPSSNTLGSDYPSDQADSSGTSISDRNHVQSKLFSDKGTKIESDSSLLTGTQGIITATFAANQLDSSQMQVTSFDSLGKRNKRSIKTPVRSSEKIRNLEEYVESVQQDQDSEETGQSTGKEQKIDDVIRYSTHSFECV